MTPMVPNIEYSVKPLHWLNAIAGISLFEIPIGYPKPKLSILYALGRFIIYGLLFWCVDICIMPRNFDVFWTMRNILYVNLAVALITSVCGLLSQKPRKEFWRRIALVDETLEKFGIDPEYTAAHNEIRRLILTWCIGGLFVLFTEAICTNYVLKDISKSILAAIVVVLPLIYHPIIELNFIIKVRFVGKRFQRVNELILTLVRSSGPGHDKDSQHISRESKNEFAIQLMHQTKNRNNAKFLLRIARQLHLDLCAISQNVSDGCNRVMSIQIAASFFLITGFGYCLFKIHREPRMPEAEKIQHYVSFGVGVLGYIIRMATVVRTSEKVTLEARKTSLIAHDVLLPRFQEQLHDEVHQLSLQIMQNPLYFTASGLIVLDFDFIREFFGAVITYLMILIQNQSDILKVTNTLADTPQDHNVTGQSTFL